MILINDARPGMHRLGPEPSHHLVRVLRKRAGDLVECSDGRGSMYSAVIVTADTRGCDLEIGDLILYRDRPAVRIHLCLAYLKGDALTRALSRSVELGVTDVTIIQSQRTQASLARIQDHRQHLERALLSAAEQCEQVHPPILHPACTFAAALEAAPAPATIVFHPGAPILRSDIAQGNLWLMIGPEGGWSGDELVNVEQSGACIKGLGSLVLRAETVPLAVLAAIQQVRGWA